MSEPQSWVGFYFDMGMRLQELAEERERLPHVPLSERFFVEPREPNAIEVLEVAHGLRSISEIESAVWFDPDDE